MEGSFKGAKESHTFFFLMSGISSLAAWNGVLTALDFFQGKFSEHNIFFLYPIPVNVANILVNIFLFLYSAKLSLDVRINFGLIISAFFMVLLPFCTYIEDHELGYLLSLPNLFLLGMFSSLYQISMTGFATKFEPRYITIFFVGTGFSGLMMSMLRILCLLVFGNSPSSRLYSAICYFIAAGLINAFTLYLYHNFKKSEAYHLSFTPSEREKITASTAFTIQTDRDSEIRNESLLTVNLELAKQNKLGELMRTLSVGKTVIGFLAFMILNYVQTFMLFPGVSLKKKVSFLDENWSPVIMITIFNAFDTIGKNFSELRNWYSPKIVFLVVLLRFAFYWSFLSIATSQEGQFFSQDWVLFITMALFALTNGFATSSLMVLAPEKSGAEDREKVGFIMVFGLIFGICSGSFLALPLADIIN